jgi:hypothetical protein
VFIDETRQHDVKGAILNCNGCRKSGRGLFCDTIWTRPFRDSGKLSSCWNFSPGPPNTKQGATLSTETSKCPRTLSRNVRVRTNLRPKDHEHLSLPLTNEPQYKFSGFQGGCCSNEGLSVDDVCPDISEECTASNFRMSKFGSGGCSTFLRNVGTNV